ncbi:hypothetical protein PORCRE_1806 [Porphyromonas crevioricanis JCM 15906]|uniref:Uncharacterized protein n=1 Tax=Porphyromonas crevioricanis JCM 15906 TaxID=1305617 RepID=T1DTX4_9PORP|nr:hypothetical protein PORCRE_1806 [Porphyromonas crevioricanis JCM 15906]SJZ80526.1 hypothetical protein SAMN02745203_00903 [Porphyromonas crevioricanis]
MQKSYALRIFDIAGVLMYSAEHFQPSQAIDISSWASGHKY